MRRRGRVPGCISVNHGHYCWRVKLPGEETKKARPHVAEGGSYVTNAPGLAKRRGMGYASRFPCARR